MLVAGPAQPRTHPLIVPEVGVEQLATSIDRIGERVCQPDRMIVAPSGMFTGGWSPWYLWQLTEHCEMACVFITGFQAAYTPGRALLEADEQSVEVEVTALMAPNRLTTR